MIEKIIIAGAGGQGIMLLGKVLASAAMREGKFVTWLPAYGAEVRGGTAYCMVVISDKEIGSPYIDKADTMIIMNAPSQEKFKKRLAAKGLLILNSSLVTQRAGKTDSLWHPFTDIASGLGNAKVANMVALGCLIARKKITGAEAVVWAMQDIAGVGRKDLVEINKKAFFYGIGLVK